MGFDLSAELAAVRGLLAKAPAEESELECGPAGTPPRKLNHNCSGKHAGMLALCRARGWRTEGYRLPSHRMQRTNLRNVAATARLDEDRVETAVDGCGVVTFALPLERMALAYARFEQLPEGNRIADAMRAHPELVGGPDGADLHLMTHAPGWFAKGGAEGLLCAAGQNGLGIALKVEDGSTRALEPALASFLGPLGVDIDALRERVIHNSRGEVVGRLALAS